MSQLTEKLLYSLVPTPKSIRKSEGDLTIPPFINSEYEDFSEYVNTFCASVNRICDKKIFSVGMGGVILRFDDSLNKSSYTLDTLGDTAVLSASDSEGILYAVATLFNILSFEEGEIKVCRVYIEDYPDKNYRTLMVDLAREWKPAHLVYRYIDICFAMKIKYLHLHFMDDRLYTLPSHAFPKVTDNSPHYTFEDIEGFRAYANARGINIIPEIEVPGHAIKLVEAYPDIFGLKIAGDAKGAEIITEMGEKITTNGILCAGTEESVNAVITLINEVMDMFPESEFINVGGDEANFNAWNYCTECQKYMKEHGQTAVKEMYCEFIGKITSSVIARGKTPIVWEGFPKEYAHLIPKETVVLSWENYYNYTEDLLADGFRIINASWQPLYIIPSYETRWNSEQIYAWDVYNWQHWWNKSRAKLNPVHVAPTEQVIGAQICSWECTYDQEINAILENLATLSERTWNERRVRSHEVFANGLRPYLQRIARLIQDR
ncbi:MAG: family 20 glycosylhydrolase [Clostridia bacterium]|nr:family 20 glycosylhydrolase [Clostridia bacterium]